MLPEAALTEEGGRTPRRSASPGFAQKGPSGFQSSLSFGATELSRPVVESESVSVSPWW